MNAKRLGFRSIRARFLLLTTLLVITLFGGFGVFIAGQNAADISKSLDSKAKSVADLASLNGAEYLANLNFVALDGLVETILKDPEVSFVGFYNDKKELVTKKPVPASTASLHTIERQLKASNDSPLLGTLKIGYKTDSVAGNRRSAALIIVGATVLAIILFWAGIRIVAERIILKPISRLSAVIEHVANGDLSQRLEVVSDDEMGILARSLNSMVENLNRMVGQVTVSADQLNLIAGNLLLATTQVINTAQMQSEGVGSTSSAVAQINASIKGVNDSVNGLSAAATESSSSILEMTSSVEEVALNTETLAKSVADVSSSIAQMSASIKQVGSGVSTLLEAANITASSIMEMDYSIKQVEQNVADASAISETVRIDAETGTLAVRESIAGIIEIMHSSEITYDVINSLSRRAKDIGNILAVIDDVAEQTNLLSLNAAIIAAQAGEHGKGFAVVADEIKGLAERTRSSTREIAKVIKGVQDETSRAVSAIQSAEQSVEKGKVLSEKSGNALNKIYEGVQRVTNQIHEIARATQEQSSGSQLIRESMEQVSEMVSRIDSATKEQMLGSGQIIASVEKMNEMTAQVRSAAQEQSNVGKFIATSTEAITGMIDQIRRASAEQTLGSRMIASSVENIESSSMVNLETTRVMDESVAKLFEQITALRKEMKSFRV